MNSPATSFIVSAAAVTLMHTLWQGALAALALRALAAIYGNNGNSSRRYRAAVACLAAMALAPVFTFGSQLRAASDSGSQASTQAVIPGKLQAFPANGNTSAIALLQNTESGNILQIVSGSVRSHAPQIVPIWLAGCVLFALRLAGAWAVIKRSLHRALPTSHPLHAQIECRVRKLAAQCGLRSVPRLRLIHKGRGPFVFGVWQTVLAIPATLAGGISPDLLDALILHELAHIQRADLLVNALQCALETLFFYHPAVWWVSAQVRIERERCCDDRVLDTLPNRAAYASALLAASELQLADAAIAAAAQNSGLKDRIERILGMNHNKLQQSGRTSPLATSGLALIMACCAAAIVILPTASSAHQQSTAARGSSSQPGEGIRIVLADSKQPAKGREPASLLVHDHDLQEVVKALNSTAVGRVQVNGIAVKNPATIKAHGADIEVDGKRILPPYTVIAMGNPAKLFDALKLGGDITLKQMHNTDPAMVTVTRLPRGQAVGTMIKVARASKVPTGTEEKQSWEIRVKLLQASPASAGELKTISTPRIMTLTGMPAKIQIGNKGADGKEISGTDFSITVSSADAGHATIKGRLRVHLEGNEENAADIPQNTVVTLDKATHIVGVTTSHDQAAIKAAQSGKLPADRDATTTIAEITVIRHQ